MRIEDLRAQAERCRWLADQADEKTRARLLRLAADYDDRIQALQRPESSRATRMLERHGNPSI